MGDLGSVIYSWTIEQSSDGASGVSTYSETWYPTADCTDPVTFLYENSSNAEYGESRDATWSDDGAPESLPDTVGAILETTTATEASATFSGDGVTFANDEVAYGFNDWSDGVPKDVISLNFDGTVWDNITYDILFVDDGDSPDAWYSGDSATADDDGFPTKLWPGNPGTRE